ncbi:MAG: endonuclease V [Candidatus Hodarchaeota archaeon]
MKEEEAEEKGIDIESLKLEQKKLAANLSLKDEFNFEDATRFAGISIQADPQRKEIIAAIVVLDEDLEIIEEKYTKDKITFPYIPGFRAYRELPVMIKAFNKLEEVPDVIFVLGHGIAHPRGLGIASHFGLSVQKPTIGIAKNILHGKEKEDKIMFKNKVIAQKIQTHKGSNPILISPGNMISIESAVELTKKCSREPHKLPEPLVKARRYLNKITKEFR